MSKNDNNNDGSQIDHWEACSAGELTKMVHRLDARQRAVRRRQVLNTALVSTAVFACVVLGLGTFMNSGGSHAGGIACSVCREHLADYQLHLIGEQQFDDEQLLTSMKIHLEKCQFCRGRFNTAYPEQRIEVSTTTRRALLLAVQPGFALAEPTPSY